MSARNVLPDTVVPKHYTVHLTPDLEKFTFEGTVTIDVAVKAPTATVVLNALDMTIHNAFFAQNGTKTELPHSAWAVDEEWERVTLTLPAAAEAGEAQVGFVYTGNLNDQMKGFYRTKRTAVQEDGSEKVEYMASTQFEPADCRRALPCWDEPIYKASFDVTLTAPDGKTILSNMHEVSSTVDAATNLRTVVFARTPVMSTYLLAFVVGSFEYIETTIDKVNAASSGEKATTTIRVYTTPGNTEKGRFALDLSARCLPLYERFFEVDYPLQKCDLIAIPDFSCGAMENWGLVTFRDSALLCDDAFRAKLGCALTVTHELAHQWFGNLVTMKWWNELWLNESFATFIEFHAVNELFPAWDAWSKFVSEDYASALALDSLVSSHPVEVDVAISRTLEIDEIFDDISYAKGCSVMRMLHAWIGPDAFRRALAAYIKQFAYGNASTTDLWKAFAAASGLPVEEVMQDWTRKQGYPILRCSEADGAVVVRQSRFLSSRPPTAEEEEQVWPVPVGVLTDKGLRHVILSKKEERLPLDGAAWVKVNTGHHAVARTLYDAPLLARLRTAAAGGSLSPLDIGGALRDMNSAARAGLLGVPEVLDFAEACTGGEDAAVWAGVRSALGSAEVVVKGDKAAEAQLDAVRRRVYAGIAAKLGWDKRDGEDGSRLQLRGSVVSALAAAKDEATLAEGRRRFDAFLASGDEAVLPSDVRRGVYCALVAADPTRATYDKLRARYEASDDDAVERNRCLAALAAPEDEALLRETLAYGFSGKVRAQNVTQLAYELAGSVAGSRLLVAHMKENFAALFDKFGSYVAMGLLGALGGLYDEADAEDLERWWGSVDESMRKCGETTMRQNLEAIRIAHALRQRNRDGVLAWIKSHA